MKNSLLQHQRSPLWNVLLLVASLSVRTPAAPGGERQLIQDNHFRKGLILWEPKPGKHVQYGTVPGRVENTKAIWGLSQWSSQFPLDPAAAREAGGALVLSNAAKCVSLGPPGADLSLAVNSAVEYGSNARSVREPWVHLLVEQEFEAPPSLQSLSAAKFHLAARLLCSRDQHRNDYDPAIHAAQFQVFFTVQNRRRQSPGYGDLLWFGIPVYDNRYRHPPEFKSKDFGGTEKFIFTPGATTFTSESAQDGSWIVIDQDVLPLMREALDMAWSKGFLSASKNIADYAIGGMNLGWELPGTFDVDLEVRDLSLLVVETQGVSAAGQPAEHQSAPVKELPVPGEVLLVEGRTAFLIPSSRQSIAGEKPWVWYAPTLPGLPGPEERWMFDQFLQAGIAIAGVDVGESYGSPAGRALFTSFYREMTRRGYSPKPVLLGRSRGGLMALSWAVENPARVGGFAGIYPVCNVASYPGVAKAAGAYQMTAGEMQARLQEHNPIDRLAPLAQAGVPLFAIHGDSDQVVPLKENSGLMRDRYRALGGSMQLIVPSGQGHNMWPGFFQNQELVAFVKAQAGPNISVSSPLDYQVVQRTDRNQGALNISGSLAGTAVKKLTVEARLFVEGKPSNWRPIRTEADARTFHARWKAPAGGWHRLEIRARSGTNLLAESVVEHVGIGEVFVVAGQSNSANHGAEKQKTETQLVSAFDSRNWRLANDPQPGASGAGGSFIPPFGDAIAQRFHVPVGIVACGVGATSVREWLPKGSTFPNPPTLTSQVQQRPDGTWECQGTIFATFTERLRQMGPGGFRAVLWHQGESDAHQDDPTRTLPGRLYREYLEKLISDSRQAIGWKAPWFVAQASYHRPGDEGSEEIRTAQALTWKDGIALEGPDTDALRGGFREDGGKGVHFSGPGLREHAARWAAKVAPWLERRLRR